MPPAITAKTPRPGLSLTLEAILAITSRQEPSRMRAVAPAPMSQRDSKLKLKEAIVPTSRQETRPTPMAPAAIISPPEPSLTPGFSGTQYRRRPLADFFRPAAAQCRSLRGGALGAAAHRRAGARSTRLPASCRLFPDAAAADQFRSALSERRQPLAALRHFDLDAAAADRRAVMIIPPRVSGEVLKTAEIETFGSYPSS